MDKLVSILFEDYIFYREHTTHWRSFKKDKPYLKKLKLTEERCSCLKQYVEWCDEHHVPPRQWLYSLFVIRLWLFAPRLQLNTLCSKKHITKFQKFTDYAFFKEYTGKGNYVMEAPKLSIDLNLEIEKRKMDVILNSGPETCMDLLDELGGYHPCSEICIYCDLRFQCAQLLIEKKGFVLLKGRQGLCTKKM
ncbi:MAG: hypothetical protein JW702_09155 [Clostridiales bacterium]|nr:hypothetical protein [Clostridiales bacterium]